jgi:ornithine cyclodeaminase/alanine dehydrogenase-like protein (mu-crystallin family)
LTVTAFGVLAAVDTGYPLLLSELTVTTALRTAATSRACSPLAGAAGEPRNGADRQWLAE